MMFSEIVAEDRYLMELKHEDGSVMALEMTTPPYVATSIGECGEMDIPGIMKLMDDNTCIMLPSGGTYLYNASLLLHSSK